MVVVVVVMSLVLLMVAVVLVVLMLTAVAAVMMALLYHHFNYHPYHFATPTLAPLPLYHPYTTTLTYPPPKYFGAGRKEGERDRCSNFCPVLHYLAEFFSEIASMGALVKEERVLKNSNAQKEGYSALPLPLVVLGLLFNFRKAGINVHKVSSKAYLIDFMLGTTLAGIFITIAIVVYFRERLNGVWDTKERKTLARVQNLLGVAGTLMLGTLGQSYLLLFLPIFICFSLSGKKLLSITVSLTGACVAVALGNMDLSPNALSLGFYAGIALCIVSALDLEKLISVWPAPSLMMHYSMLFVGSAFLLKTMPIVLVFFPITTCVFTNTSIHLKIKKKIEKVVRRLGINKLLERVMTKYTLRRIKVGCLNILKILVALLFISFIVLNGMVVLGSEYIILPKNLQPYFTYTGEGKPMFYHICVFFNGILQYVYGYVWAILSEFSVHGITRRVFLLFEIDIADAFDASDNTITIFAKSFYHILTGGFAKLFDWGVYLAVHLYSLTNWVARQCILVIKLSNLLFGILSSIVSGTLGVLRWTFSFTEIGDESNYDILEAINGKTSSWVALQSLGSSGVALIYNGILFLLTLGMGGFAVLFTNNFKELTKTNTSMFLTHRGFEEGIYEFNSGKFVLNSEEDRQTYPLMFFDTYSRESGILDVLETKGQFTEHEIIGDAKYRKMPPYYSQIYSAPDRNKVDDVRELLSVLGIFNVNMTKEELEMLKILYDKYPNFKPDQITGEEQKLVMAVEAKKAEVSYRPEKTAEKQKEKFKTVLLQKIADLLEYRRRYYYKFTVLGMYFFGWVHDEVQNLASLSIIEHHNRKVKGGIVDPTRKYVEGVVQTRMGIIKQEFPFLDEHQSAETFYPKYMRAVEAKIGGTPRKERASGYFLENLADMENFDFSEEDAPLVVVNMSRGARKTHTYSITYGRYLNFSEVLETKNYNEEASRYVISNTENFDLTIEDKNEDCAVVVSVNEKVIEARVLSIKSVNGCTISLENVDLENLISKEEELESGKPPKVTISIYSNHVSLVRHLEYTETDA